MVTSYPLRARRTLAVLGDVRGLRDQCLPAAAHHGGPLATRVRRIQPPTGPFKCASFDLRLCVLADLVEDPFDQGARAGHPHPVEIDQLALDAVRGRTPAVLRDRKRRMSGQRLSGIM